MRIVFNILETLKPRTGIGQYAARLSAALAQQLPAGDLFVFPDGWLAGVVQRMQRLPAQAPAPRRGARRWWFEMRSAAARAAKRAARSGLGVLFRRAALRHNYDLYHEPNFIPFDCDLPTIVTIHDLSVVLFPEWHPADRVRMYERQFASGLERAAHILTDTEFLRRQIVQHLGIPRERVTAVPLGVGPEFGQAMDEDVAAVRRRYDLPERYLLFVGTIEPRKNLAMLLRAYCDLPGALRDACPLVLAGSWGWKSESVAEYYHSEARAKGVRCLGYTPDDALPALYAGARALVYPSLYEGFGLPPVEMLACGGAVISSTADVLREVLGGVGHFLDAHDRTGWRNAMSRAITDDSWLEMLRRGGRQRAARFSWERCAAGTAAVYESLTRPALRRAA
jgi:alpha-1,3-rhamnosyl/mannosyltransferase